MNFYAISYILSELVHRLKVSKKIFYFIQQKAPPSIRGEMNAKHLYNSVGVHKPLLNEVKASGGCHRF
jgi:hypothetical protein